jgi:hypothetical protein
MRPSRGMGCINPAKMPGGAKKKKAPAVETEYSRAPKIKNLAKGGESKVNQAGNYTKPSKRKALFNSIKSSAVQGTAAGQWSARKAQLLAKKYKASGGGYK